MCVIAGGAVCAGTVFYNYDLAGVNEHELVVDVQNIQRDRGLFTCIRHNLRAGVETPCASSRGALAHVCAPFGLGSAQTSSWSSASASDGWVSMDREQTSSTRPSAWTIFPALLGLTCFPAKSCSEI